MLMLAWQVPYPWSSLSSLSPPSLAIIISSQSIMPAIIPVLNNVTALNLRFGTWVSHLEI